MVDKSLDDTIQQFIECIALDGVPENTDKYLESKLPLFSNLKQHFDTIPNLKPILTAYMLYEQRDHSAKQVFKEKLVTTGVYHDEDLLEFLHLIAEIPRIFDNCPQNVSDEELGRYFFDKYKALNENWSSKTFRFSLEHNHSYQTERERLIEEVAIGMIAHSRASLAKAITEPPSEISELIRDADNYFQQAFYSTFGRKAPISLTDVTHVTKEYTEHADRISGNTFIQIDNFYLNRDKFVHVVIHEAMHLCFNGFYETPIEEGINEFFIEKMYKEHPPANFSYSPVSDTYSEWKQNLKSVFGVLPESKSHFTQYFLTQDIDPLIGYLQRNLTEEKVTEIENKHYSRGINNFIDSMRKLTIRD